MNYKSIINPKYTSLVKFVNELPQKFDREGVLIYDSRNFTNALTIHSAVRAKQNGHIPML